MDEDKRILQLYSRTRPTPERIRSFKDAQELAESLGDVLTKAAADIDFAAMTEEEIVAVLSPVMKEAYSDAVKAGSDATYARIKSANLGLRTIEPEYNAAIAKGIAKDLAGKEVSEEYFRNLVTNKIVQGVDETLRMNAEAHNDMGLEVRIVRTYSDLGLRQGTPYAEPCQWCLDRCGEWDDYRDAFDAGCFERHPGCCCQIDYDVGTTHTASRDKWNWYNK